jgi:urease accessory protein
LAALSAQSGDLPYPVAVGALAGVSGIAADDVAAAYLHNFMANLISAAVRLVPLGQTTGLAVLARLEPVLGEVIAARRHCTLDDIGGFCFCADIASARHETQHTRLFRS